MYNRYVPQPDGSYQKNRVKEQSRQPPSPPHAPPPPCPPPCDDPPPWAPVSKGVTGAFDFLRRLLPKGLDTGDLLVIVLLLLMAGDCESEQNTALLTLALYLFL